MKKSFAFRAFGALLVMVSVFLTGCAGQLKQMPDGDYIGVTTAGDSLDRSASFIGIYEKVMVEGKAIFKLKEKGQLSAGPTVGGQAIVGAVAGTLPAIVQGEYGVKIANKAKCGEGSNCGTVINAVAESGSASSSNTAVGVDVQTGTTGGCSTCGLPPVKQH